MSPCPDLTPLITSTGGGCDLSGVSPGQRLRTSQHDLYRAAGIGRSAWLVHAALDQAIPLPVKVIAARAGRARSTVYTVIKRLADAGLAERTDTGWVRVDRPLDEPAAELGVLGRTEQQREAHQQERAAYREWIGQDDGILVLRECDPRWVPRSADDRHSTSIRSETVHRRPPTTPTEGVAELDPWLAVAGRRERELTMIARR